MNLEEKYLKPEVKIGEQITLDFTEQNTEQEKPKTSPVEDFITKRDEIAERYGILNKESIKLVDDVWYVGALTLESFLDLTGDGNHQVHDKNFGYK